MKLITLEVDKALTKSERLTIKEVSTFDSKVIVRYFNPCGVGEWLIVKGTKEGDRWLLYGYIKVSKNWEWGYIAEEELNKIITQPFGTGLSRDILLKPNERTIKDILKGRI